MDFPALPSLETARLRLLELDPEEHFEKINALTVDTFETVHPWVPSMEKLPTLEDTLKLLRDLCENRRKGDSCSYGIVVKASADPNPESSTDQLIGICTMMKLRSPLGDQIRDQIDSPEYKNPYLIGYWINKRFEGHGFATEAVGKLVEFGKEQRNADSYFAQIDLGNPKSSNLVKRLGFDFQKRAMYKNNRRSDWPAEMPNEIYRKLV